MLHHAHSLRPIVSCAQADPDIPQCVHTFCFVEQFGVGKIKLMTSRVHTNSYCRSSRAWLMISAVWAHEAVRAFCHNSWDDRSLKVMPRCRQQYFLFFTFSLLEEVHTRLIGQPCVLELQTGTLGGGAQEAYGSSLSGSKVTIPQQQVYKAFELSLTVSQISQKISATQGQNQFRSMCSMSLT